MRAEREIDSEQLTATLTRADWTFIHQALRAKFLEDMQTQEQARAVAQTVGLILNRRTP